MIIAVAFSITSAVALVGLGLILREFLLNRAAAKRGGHNGKALEASSMLIVLVGAMTLTNFLLLLLGVAALVGIRQVGWVLVLIPPIKLAAAIYVLRSIRRL